MSSVFDRKADEAIKAALRDKIVLRQIFGGLPLNDLKECRLVNRTWNVEAVRVIKDFRQCHAHISKDPPCSDLLALAQVVSKMNVVTITSLSIVLHRPGHSECKSIDNQAKLLGILLERLPLQRLHVSWETAFEPLTCPAIKFVIDLLRRKVLELSTLEFTFLPARFLTYFGQVWAPWLPKLEVIDIGELDGFHKEFIRMISDGAPNLKKIRGNTFDSGILEAIPEDKYYLLDGMCLTVECDTEVAKCLKLALARPTMSYLYLSAPSCESERQYMTSYISILEKIFASSCKSLTELTMRSPIFPLDLLKFPPLISVESINISTEFTTPPPHLLHVLRSIDYPKIFPALYKVEVEADMDYDPDYPYTNPWENSDAPQVVQVRPSNTVKHLEISADVNTMTFKELGEIFPNVVHLDAVLIQSADPTASASHIDLWAAWPYLETVSLGECSGALTRNFDADFLGITPQEVEVLRQLDDESLEKMNIVPTRPSVITLLRLKRVKFEFHSSDVQTEIDKDQVFLSKVTGILAFKKMARQGLQIQFICKDAQAALRLNHLSPFVALVSKF